MNTWHSLKNECIKINSKATDKKMLLNEIANLSINSQALKNHSKDEVLAQLQAREQISSTGLEHGIAIPHCSFSDIDEFIVGVITTENEIEFNSIDGKKASIFIFIIGPDQQRNKHIKLLSSIAKAISKESTINLLKKADSAKMIQDIFNSQIDYNEPSEKGKSKSKITIIIQKEELFDDILQLLSAEVEGSIAIYETEAASRYLHRMPLFASFWGSQEDKFNRIITAVIDKAAVNNAIRKIKKLIPDLETESGILLTVEDLSFTLGSIDF